jgi:hypothetical protein
VLVDFAVPSSGSTLTILGKNLLGKPGKEQTIVELGEQGALDIVSGTDTELVVRCFIPGAPAFECNDGDYKLSVAIEKIKGKKSKKSGKSSKGGQKDLAFYDLTITSDDDDDPTNELQALSRSGNNVTLSNGGGTVSIADDDNDPTNENQDLSSSATGTSRTIDISAGTGTTIDVADNDNDPANELQTVSQSGNSVTLSNGGGTVSIADLDNDPANELQTVSQSGNNVTLSNGGGTVSIADPDSDPANELQNLGNSAVGTARTITISGGSATTIDVADLDNDAANELQNLTQSGTSVTLSNGGGTITIADLDNDPANELQNLGNSAAGTSRTISISGGTATTVDIADNDNDPNNENQNLSSSATGTNRTIDISAGTGTTIDIADPDSDPANEIQALTQSGTSVTLSNGGGTVSIADPDSDPANELQNLSNFTSGTNRTITISGGAPTTISVADNDNNSSNELQTLSRSGNGVVLSNGGGGVSIADNDNSSSNELQSIFRSGTNVILSNGGGSASIADNDDNSSNELNTSFSLSGSILSLTDAGGTRNVNLTGIGGSDNLGNHTATTTLNMNNQIISNVREVLPPLSAIFTGRTGRFGQATNFKFPTFGGTSGTNSLVIETQQTGESAGIAMNGQSMAIWSPGDGNRLLSVHDEDGMSTTSNGERWFLNGSGTAFTVSDATLKENVSGIDDGLSRALALRGVTYNLIGESTDPDDREMGVIAQEVETVVPEVVDTNEAGIKSVNYTGLIPVLIEAIKAQQEQIDALKARLTALEP